MTKEQSMNRKQLREAIAAREIVRADLVNARTALANAGRVVDQARATLAEYDGLDDEVADFRAQGLRGGGTTLAAIPPALQSKLDLRTRALNDMSIAETVCSKLTGECAALETALNDATVAVEQRAGDVLAEVATGLADDFNAKLDDIRKLHRTLAYLSRMAYPHPVIPTLPDGRALFSQAKRSPTMPGVVVAAVAEAIQGNSRLYEPPGLRAAELEVAQDFWRALQDDADATL